ncbi:MAG: LD-carboxypeptidase [Pseudomonadota bacterium]
MKKKSIILPRGKGKLRAISKGSSVAVIAPASPFERKRLDRAVRWLEGEGISVRYRPEIFSRKGYLAGSDARRLKEFITAWRDPKIDAIFAARGGYGSMRLLETLVRKSKIFGRPSHPKIVSGMSDLTVLLNRISVESGLPTIHGPVLAGDLFERMSETSRRRWLSFFRGGKERILKAPHDHRVLHAGTASGRLWGGNLATVAAAVGTRFEIPASGILFLEEVSEPPYRIDRMFAQLALSGYFRKIRGLLLGDFTDLSGKPHRTAWLEGIVDRFLGARKIPVLAGIRAGHRHANVLLPIGAPVRIEARGRRLLLPPFVREVAS